MREQLEQLVQQMLDRGVRYEDARRELERCFIVRALARSRGSLSRTADLLGVHRNTLSRKIVEYRLARKG
jgi:DNA-binding NtrC family response regulator